MTARPNDVSGAPSRVVKSGSTEFDLVAYAREHRYRLRNLHDGGPVPPAIWKPPRGYRPVYVGEDDRCDAIVGRNGYVAFDGELGWLGITLFFKSALGVNKARDKIQAMGGTVTQEGDTEIAGTIPVESIEEGLLLIRVSKLKPGPPGGRPDNLARAQDTLRTLESTQRG